MIMLENVTKYFGQSKAVNSLSFSITKGEIVGFLGPNGAGKTTTLRMIAGFLVPDKGRILIDGIDIERDSISVQRKIGYLPENNPLYKTMRVGEFLEFASKLQGIPASGQESAIERVVRSIGLSGVFYRPIGELSKGYRQRVGIAASLVHTPDIIIMDEPAEGLDPNQRDEIRQLIRDLAKDRTVIMSTHVMQEASAVCSRLIIIRNGKIVADGAKEDISRISSNRATLLVDVEGEGVEHALSALVGQDALLVRSRTGSRFVIEIASKDGREFRPSLSELAWKHKWILWGMREGEGELEEAFRTLTKGKQ